MPQSVQAPRLRYAGKNVAELLSGDILIDLMIIMAQSRWIPSVSKKGGAN
jgi:hypothetical protein